MREKSDAPTLSCQDARLLMGKKLVGDALTFEEQQTLEAHLNNCSRCCNHEHLVFALPTFLNIEMICDLDQKVAAVMERLQRDRQKKRGGFDIQKFFKDEVEV